MDWARDIYRIAIMRQLKSLVTGQPVDEVSLADSDMFSMRRGISNWIPAPPSTVFDGFAESSHITNDEDCPPAMMLEDQALLDIPIPNTKLGSVRPASYSDFRFVCLYLTEKLIPSFLQVVGGRRDNKSNTERAARRIINFITGFSEVLVMSKADLDLFQSLWTETVVPTGPNEDTDDLYVVMEASWYLSPSWEITREISCLAVTKSAFNSLKTYANFRVRHKGIDSLPKCERRCTSSVIRQFIGCIRSGSPWQVLLAAISCTLVTIYPLPARRREDFMPPVDALGLGYPQYDRVKSFVRNYLRLDLWKPRKNTTVPNAELQRLLKQGYTMKEIFDMKRDRPPKHTDTSWKRISHQRTHILEEELHIRSRCGRCTKSPERIISPFAHGFLDTRNQPILSDYDAILVVSLQYTGPGKSPSFDSCVFALGKLHELKDNMGLSIMIDDLIQGDLIYHTIKYDVDESFGHYYNLPLPYRSVTSKEKFRLHNWVRELRDQTLLAHTEDKSGGKRSELDEGESTHSLMCLLRIGHTEQEASLYMNSRPGYSYNDIVDSIARENDSRGEWESFLSFRVKLSVGALAERYSSWIEGKLFLKRVYPKQFDYIASLNSGVSSK
jgi:hypothetical protein